MNNLCTLRLTGCRLTRLRLMRDRLEAELLAQDSFGPGGLRNWAKIADMQTSFEIVSTLRHDAVNALMDICSRMDPNCQGPSRLACVRKYAHVCYLIARLEIKKTNGKYYNWQGILTDLRNYAKSGVSDYCRYSFEY